MGLRPGRLVSKAIFFANLNDPFVHFFGGFFNDLFDSGGMDSAVLDKFGQTKTGDLPANGIEGRNNDHAGGVVDNDIDASGFFKGTNVSTLAANDSAFHVVVGDIDRGDGAFAGLAGGIALEGVENQIPTFLFRFLFCLGDDFLDQSRGFVRYIVFEAVQNQFFSLIFGQIGLLEQ